MAHEYVDNLESLNEYFDNAIMYGEIGLDHYYLKDKDQYPAQYKLLNYFFEKAQKQSKVVILHLDGAEEKGLEMIQNYSLKKVIVHGYKGSIETLQQMLDEGYYFSIGGNMILDEFKSYMSSEDWNRVHQIISDVPLEQLLTETDGPCRTEPEPPPDAPRSMPTYIFKMIDKISKVRNISEEELTSQVKNNFLRILDNDSRLSKYREIMKQH